MPLKGKFSLTLDELDALVWLVMLYAVAWWVL